MLIVLTELLTKPKQQRGALVLTEGETFKSSPHASHEHHTCQTCSFYSPLVQQH